MIYDPVSIGLTVTGGNGQWVYVKCPFHNDSTASAEFNVLKGSFYCFVCDETFKASELAEELGGSVEVLSTEFSSYETEREEYEWRNLLSAPLAVGHSYLKLRRVTDEQVEKFQIRCIDTHIVFPSRNLAGEFVGVILRSIDGSQPRYMKLGNVVNLWPAYELRNSSKNVLVVEGVFGSLRSRRAGLDSFAQLKSSPSEETFALLNGRSITAFLDDDLAGCIGSLKLIRSGAKAVSPGGEIDEMSVREIRSRCESASYNYSHFLKIAKLAGKVRLLKRLGYVHFDKIRHKSTI